MSFFTEDAAYEQMRNFAKSIKQYFSVEDCEIYAEKTDEAIWLGLQIQKNGKPFIAKMLYKLNETGGLTLQNKWWVVCEQEKEIAKLPSLREIFHLLSIKNI